MTSLTAAALWLNTACAGFDTAVTVAIHKLYEMGGGFFTPFFEFISLLGKGGVALILLSLCLIAYKPTRRFGTAMALGLAIGALLTNLWLKVWVARPRPYSQEGSIFHELWLTVGQNMESDKSFPSGHTTAAFGAMVPVFLVGDKKKSWTALIFAVLMGIARIYLVVHYPTDVVGGILVGTAAGVVGALAAPRLPDRWYELDFYKQQKGKHECSQ